MERLATGLARLLRTPVVDMTGAKGVYSFTLEYAPESTRLPNPVDAPQDSSGPSIYTVLHQQLGLKLESRKAPVDMLIIDKAEKPTDN